MGVDRKDVNRNIQEDFEYDQLNRLTGYGGKIATYDEKGNITRKSDVGSQFNYATAGKPYAISGVTSPAANAIPMRNQALTYNSFRWPVTVSEGNYTATFTYNYAGSRIKMELKKNGSVELKRHYLSDCYELDEGVAGTKEKLYLGGDYYTAPAVYVKQGSGNWEVYSIFRDYLGSITHITNRSGGLEQELSYDAWGRLRNPATQTVYAPDTEPALFLGRGYTGHEHLPCFGLVNMNARMYDPATGRFLSPDPYVQSPDFSQNFNRYSYALNNPMRYTDTDGEFWHIVIGAAVGGVANLVANWDHIDGFWQGVTAFGVGAAAGAATAGAGAGFWAVAGVSAAGGAVTAATNSVIAQTGTNFSGFSAIDWGQVGASYAVGGVAGFAGSAAGYWASTVSFTVNGISNPILQSAIVSPIASGAGHIAGGTTANLFAGQSFGDAFTNSFEGIGQSMAIGMGVGVATTMGTLYADGRNPLTGEKIVPKQETKILQRFNSVESLINDAEPLQRLKGGVRQGFIQGNADDIFQGLSQQYGAKIQVDINTGHSFFSSGNIRVDLTGSSQGIPTLRINDGIQIYKIRIQ